VHQDRILQLGQFVDGQNCPDIRHSRRSDIESWSGVHFNPAQVSQGMGEGRVCTYQLERWAMRYHLDVSSAAEPASIGTLTSAMSSLRGWSQDPDSRSLIVS
jgi:hypothetical protein